MQPTSTPGPENLSSDEDATSAVDSLTVSWGEQAATSAKEYLATSAFSRSSPIKQLEYEGSSCHCGRACCRGMLGSSTGRVGRRMWAGCGSPRGADGQG